MQSVGRAFYLSLHLLNTLLLLGALALTAWFSRAAVPESERRSTWVMAALPIAALVSVTGAIAALGDTLFPATSLAQGFQQDFSGAANFLFGCASCTRAFAILAACYFVVIAIVILRSENQREWQRNWPPRCWCSRSRNCRAGAINVILLAPVWMQITHLLLADMVWISLVLLAVEARPRALAAKLH